MASQVTTVTSPPITTGRYYFLKGRFRSSINNLYGLFLIVFNPQKSIESIHSVVSTFSNIYDLEPHLEWHLFEEKITDIRWKGNCNMNMTNAMLSMFETVNKDSKARDELYSMISTYNYTQIEIMIFDLINRIVRDKEATLESGIQESTPEEVSHIREQKRVEHEQKNAKSAAPLPSYNFQVEEGATVVPVNMILSPVQGKLLYELKVGDKIMLKFNPKTDLGNFYLDLYQLKTPEGKIKGIPGEVIDIKADAKNLPVNILARIDEHMYGVASEEDRHVRVTLYDPKVNGAIKLQQNITRTASKISAQNETGLPKKHSSSSLLLFGFLTFFLMVVLLLVYLFI